MSKHFSFEIITVFETMNLTQHVLLILYNRTQYINEHITIAVPFFS